MRSRPSGSCTTGRSLSGMSTNRGESSRQQLVQPDAVGGAHLVGVRAQVAAPAGPQHDRRDDVAGAGLVVVEQPEHGVGAERHAELLVELAARRVDRRPRPGRAGRRAAPTAPSGC